MIQSLGIRIREIRESLNLGRHEFSMICEVKKGTLENIETRKQRATEDLISAIGKNWPQFAYWLITGLTDEEHGHISPDIERTHRDSKRAASDTG